MGPEKHCSICRAVAYDPGDGRYGDGPVRPNERICVCGIPLMDHDWGMHPHARFDGAWDQYSECLEYHQAYDNSTPQALRDREFDE